MQSSLNVPPHLYKKWNVSHLSAIYDVLIHLTHGWALQIYIQIGLHPSSEVKGTLLSWRPKIWPALQITLLVIKRTILRAVKKLPYFLLLSSLHNIFEQLCTGFFPSINKEFKQVICRNARCRAILRYCSFFCLYLKSQNKWIIQRIDVLSVTEF